MGRCLTLTLTLMTQGHWNCAMQKYRTYKDCCTLESKPELDPELSLNPSRNPSRNPSPSLSLSRSLSMSLSLKLNLSLTQGLLHSESQSAHLLEVIFGHASVGRASARESTDSNPDPNPGAPLGPLFLTLSVAAAPGSAGPVPLGRYMALHRLSTSCCPLPLTLHHRTRRG